jgi:hypothetical protein
MKSKAELATELAAAKAKRKPVLSDAEKKERDEAATLQAELDAEYRALRAEENEDIVAKHAPTKARAFFDFDEDNVHPATVEYSGMTCTLHSRFVVRHANADDMEVFDDAQNAVVEAQKTPSGAVDVARAAESTTKQLGRRCIVYPEQVTREGSAMHDMSIKASLHYFGGAAMALGNAAAQLGGLHALERQAKS